MTNPVILNIIDSPNMTGDRTCQNMASTSSVATSQNVSNRIITQPPYTSYKTWSYDCFYCLLSSSSWGFLLIASSFAFILFFIQVQDMKCFRGRWAVIQHWVNEKVASIFDHFIILFRMRPFYPLGLLNFWLHIALKIKTVKRLPRNSAQDRIAVANRCSDCVRFEVFTAVGMKNDAFWDVTPCGSWKSRHFGGI
jgi:hypothetical protein